MEFLDGQTLKHRISQYLFRRINGLAKRDSPVRFATPGHQGKAGLLT
jgi:hypothetical protein